MTPWAHRPSTMRVLLATLTTLAALLILGAITVGLHRLTDTISDLDGFYHLRHAWLYRTTGLFRTDFPWVQFSVIRLQASDLWYGFHLLLVPFTLVEDPIAMIRWSSMACTACALWLYYASVRWMGLRHPLVWTLFFVLISAQTIYRLTMLRPHCLSLGLDLVLLALLVCGPGGWRQWLLAFLISAVLGSIHLALAWMPLLLFGVVTVVQLALRRPTSSASGAAIAAGLLVGIVARPHPRGAFALIYTQLVRWVLEKRSHLLMMGTEARPVSWFKFADQYLPLSILVALAFVWLLRARRRAPDETGARYLVVAWSALVLEGIFLAITIVLAQRAGDYLVTFGVLFLAAITSLYVHGAKAGWGKRLSYSMRVAASFFVAILLLWSVINNIYRYQRTLWRAPHPLATRDVAEWLAANTPEGSVVFPVEWEKFAPLFFWNQHNYYINGMDPIFEYDYDAALYWKHHYLLLDSVASDRGRTLLSVAPDAPPEDVYSVLTQDFHAAAVVADPMVNPRLIDCLRADRRFKQTFEGAHEVVFQPLPAGPR